MPETFDLLGRNQIDDRLADDLVARVTEHPAARAVDVGVTPLEVDQEDAVRRQLDQITRPRVALLQGDVGAVERHGDEDGQDQSHDRGRGRQNGNLERWLAGTEGRGDSRDGDTEQRREHQRWYGEPSDHNATEASRGHHAHQSRCGAFQQHPDRDEQESDDGGRRYADHRHAHQAIERSRPERRIRSAR